VVNERRGLRYQVDEQVGDIAFRLAGAADLAGLGELDRSVVADPWHGRP
jgi:hypothetical protein